MPRGLWVINLANSRSMPPRACPRFGRDDEAEGGNIVKDMTAQDLAEHLEQLQQATQEDLDELLHDLLVRVYPTKTTQDS